jgi:hypothetical protein
MALNTRGIIASAQEISTMTKDTLTDSITTIFTDAEIFEMLNRTEHSAWKPNAAVLVIEHRICSCGAPHNAPTGPFAEFKRKTSDGTQRRLSKIDELPPNMNILQLPRRIDHVVTHVDRCQFCWSTDYDGTSTHIQLHLFPDDPRTYVTPKRYEAAVNGVIADAVALTSGSLKAKRKAKPKADPVVPFQLSDF